MKPYRVAVCLSGQARTWRTAARNIRAFFDIPLPPKGYDAVEVDYFLHCWDTNTWRRGPDRSGRSMIVEPLPDGDRAAMAAMFEPKALLIESYPSVPACRPWDGMFRSMMRCAHLKRNHELENHFDYDCVVRTRFDLIFPPERRFVLHPMQTLTLYTITPSSKFEREYFSSEVNDIFFYGESATMDLITDCHREYLRRSPETVDRSAPTEGLWNTDHIDYMRFGPNAILWHYAASMGINLVNNPSQNSTWVVVREKAARAGLDTIDDFEEVAEIFRKWYQ